MCNYVFTYCSIPWLNDEYLKHNPMGWGCLIFSLLQVTIFIKSCKEQIDVLKNLINDEEETSRRWLGIRRDNANADTTAHKHGVVRVQQFPVWISRFYLGN